MNDFKTRGEFEKQESVLTSWPLVPFSAPGLDVDEVEAQIVENLVDEVEVIVNCYDESVKERAVSVLKSRGLDTNRIRFTVFPAPIIYPRDFGAEVVTDGKGEKALVKFDFDTYGFYGKTHPTSKLLASFGEFHAKTLNVDTTIAASIVSEGGDREFNGDGVMMSILNTEHDKRNPEWRLSDLEEEFKRALNLEKIIWLPLGTYDDDSPFEGPIPSADGSYSSYRASSANGHIDEMCRFVGKDTVLLAHVTQAEADKNALHARNKERLDLAREVLKRATTADGKPLKIVLMPTPEPIYVDIFPEDDAYSSWREEGKEHGNRLLNGQPFPQGKMNVLPAQSYCNFLVANGVVLAQKYYRQGMSEECRRKDEDAVRILSGLFPDRKVVAIDTLPLNMYGGGIHCNTRNVPA